MDAIARCIQSSQKKEDLARALEMPERGDTKTVLDRWQKMMAESEVPTRQHLMFHLENIGMPDLHEK